MRRWLQEAGYDSVIASYPYRGFAPIQYSATFVRPVVEYACEHYEDVTIVGHSMGGLVGRYLLTKPGETAGVRAFVSIGTPHLGTRVADFAPWSKSAQQMRIESNFLRRLRERPWPQGISALALNAEWEEVVVPRSNANIDFGDNIMIKGVTHGSIILDKRTAMALTAWLAEKNIIPQVPSVSEGSNFGVDPLR